MHTSGKCAYQQWLLGGGDKGMKLNVKQQCMESVVRDLHHPYIPSTTMLGDNNV